MNKSSSFLSPKKGFTFIEIMVTVIIMGVLSTMGVSTFQSTQKKARDVKRKTDFQTVTKALESYMNDKGEYPPSKDNGGMETGKILWCGDAVSPTACSWGDPLTDIASSGDDKTVYMAALPKESVTNQTFVYEGVEINGKIKGYKLYARLENTKDQDIPSSGQYDPICRSGDTSNAKYCNYAITSDAVADPVGCDVDTSACTTDTTCCTKTCFPSYYKYSTFTGYADGHCTPTSFCGTTAPSGYTTQKGKEEGDACEAKKECCSDSCTTFYKFAENKYTEPNAAPIKCPEHKLCGTSNTGYTTTTPKANGVACTAASECCSNSCNTFYTQANGSTCPTTKVCSIDASTAPTGFHSTCCLTNTSSCTGNGADTSCCGGYCCGGKCQAGPCCLANGAACSTTSLACCTGTVCGTDADGDSFFSTAKGANGTCQTAHPYTDCDDANINAKPGQTACFTTPRANGSYDYNCKDGSTFCGTTYYSSWWGWEGSYCGVAYNPVCGGAGNNLKGISSNYCTRWDRWGSCTQSVACTVYCPASLPDAQCPQCYRYYGPWYCSNCTPPVPLSNGLYWCQTLNRGIQGCN